MSIEKAWLVSCDQCGEGVFVHSRHRDTALRVARGQGFGQRQGLLLCLSCKDRADQQKRTGPTSAPNERTDGTQSPE